MDDVERDNVEEGPSPEADSEGRAAKLDDFRFLLELASAAMAVEVTGIKKKEMIKR